MKSILFFATYPTKDNIKDGMIQRIKAVDAEFTDWHKIYVQISNRMFIHKEHFFASDKMIEVYRLNLFFHLFLICKLICRSNNIYIHSLHNFFKVSILSSFEGKNITIDLHGIVPEEMKFLGKRIYSRFLGLAEERMFKVASNFVYVSEEMQNFYFEKYPFIKNKINIIKPIYPQNVLRMPDRKEVEILREELGISSNDIVILYSGNMQKWQNIELSVEIMKRYPNENYHYLFLTKDKEKMEHLISKSGCKNLHYIVKSVSPAELNKYYMLAHYGFILRDKHILNRVAAPTKMVEYLFFGIIPIVKYEEIGDVLKLGYEYISYKSDLSNLEPKKSKKNENIAMTLLNRNSETELSALY